MLPSSAFPYGNPNVQFTRDARGTLAGRLGQLASPTANIRGRRVGGYKRMVGPMLQQALAARGAYRPTVGPGMNLASYMNQIAFRAGMRGW